MSKDERTKHPDELIVELLGEILQELRELKEKPSNGTSIYVYPAQQTYPYYQYPQITYTYGSSSTGTYGVGGSGWTTNGGETGGNEGGVGANITWISPSGSTGGALTPEQVSEVKDQIDEAFGSIVNQTKRRA